MSSAEKLPARIESIDALRGFDMFWIIGGDSLAVAILAHLHSPWAKNLAEQFDHVTWEGFRFYDLIFPLFMFLVGCVLPYSLDKYRNTPSDVYWRIARRVIGLFLLGLIGNGLLKFDWPNLRIAGVLQRIGICYGIAALIYVHSRTRVQVLIVAGILVGYWCLLRFTPVPGGFAGDYSMEGNLAGWLDRNYLPGKILKPYYGYGDNEGILSTIPAVATVLLGGLTGTWLSTTRSSWQKLSGLVLGGGVCLGIGYQWGESFPIIKNLWTSSFVLVAGGWSLLLLAAFYLVIDIWQFRRWAKVWVIVGMNAITIYVAERFIDFDYTSEFFLGGAARLAQDWKSVVLLAGSLAAKLIFLWFLFRQRVFLRV